MNEVMSELEVANLLKCVVTTVGECARDSRQGLSEATERAAAVIAQAECPTNNALEHAHHDALTTGCGLVRMHSTGEAEHIAPEQFRYTGKRVVPRTNSKEHAMQPLNRQQRRAAQKLARG